MNIKQIIKYKKSLEHIAVYGSCTVRSFEGRTLRCAECYFYNNVSQRCKISAHEICLISKELLNKINLKTKFKYILKR